MFLCVFIVVYCLSSHTKLVIVQGEGEQLLEKVQSSKHKPFLYASWVFQSALCFTSETNSIWANCRAQILFN